MAEVRGQQLVDVVRRDLARAKAVTAARLDIAQRRLASARTKLAQVRAAADQVPQRLGQLRDARLRELSARHASAVAELAGRAARAAGEQAPGAATAPWPEWVPTPVVERRQAQGPVRVGEVRLAGCPPVPALVPLLDRAHLVVRVAGRRPDGDDDPAGGAGSGGAAGAAGPNRAAGAADRDRADPDRAAERAGLGRAAERAGLGRGGGRPVEIGWDAPAVADPRQAADAVVTTVLLRALGRTAPGTVRLTGYDPEQLGGGLAGFAPLATAGLLTFVGPGGLGRLLDDLVDQIRRINETVLAGEHASLRELAEATGRRPEPWRVAVLLGGGTGGDRDELTRHEQAQLERVLRTGVACGVHLILRGLPLAGAAGAATVETVTIDPRTGVALVSTCRSLPVRLDPPPPPGLVTTTSRDIAELVAAGPAPAAFTDLIPARLWAESAAAGLTAPVGEGVDGRLVDVTLADYPPHALVGGPSGTGKTNLIYAWIGALAARYPPSEVEFYLLDFKEGVSFSRFAPSRRDPTWLPHVRLVGVNVNTDREFGLALLRFLAEQLRRRAEAVKRFDVTKLSELRAEDPAGHWPRIVAVIDEFQVLLAGRDAVASEAATLLEDLARRGRSQGIHLVLSSQDVSGIEALWGRHGMVAQFTLRVALPKARRILHETNPAADLLPRHHAVVNADSGAPAANRVVRVPGASDRDVWTGLQHRLWQARPAGLAPPRLFDGDAVPLLDDAPDFHALAGAGPARPDAPAGRGPVALLGETIDVTPRAARLALPRLPGRNLAVLGTRVPEATAVLAAAARSLARQYPPGAARWSVACLDDVDGDGPPTETAAAARALLAELPADTGWYDPLSVTELLAVTAAGLEQATVPHFLVLYAVDGAAARLAARGPAGSGHQHLRQILQTGPERHTHVLGWWRGVARLRDDLGGVGTARYDSIGAWVALDVHGGELTPPLYPKPGGLPWYPRPWRGLYFDRSVHRTAEVIIPYGQR